MLRLGKAALAAVTVGLATFGTALADDAPPPIREFDIATIEKLGRAMYEQDQFAWKGTDALLARLTADEKTQVRGWVVEPWGAGTRVRFLRDGTHGPEAFYDIDFMPGRQPAISAPTDRTLSPDELAQDNARTVALSNIEHRCYERYDTVVLKDPQGDGWLAWAIGATRDSNAVIMGGHYRFTVSADGKTMTRRDALSRGCLVMSKIVQGNPVVALTTTHIVSASPVETHVFTNLQYGLPIWLLTTSNGKFWAIEDGHICAADESGAVQPPCT